MTRRFQQQKLNDLGLSVDIPLDNFVKSGKVHDYSENKFAATTTNTTPTFPGFTFNGTDSLIDILILITLL